MARRNRGTFAEVEPVILTQELDVDIAERAFKRRKLSEDWLSDAEFFQQLVMEEIRREMAEKILALLEGRHPTLKDFVRAKKPFPLAHPLLVDGYVRAIMANHNARTLCYIAGQAAMREDPAVEQKLEPDAMRTVLGSPHDFPTISSRIGYYVEESLFQKHGTRIMHTLND